VSSVTSTHAKQHIQSKHARSWQVEASGSQIGGLFDGMPEASWNDFSRSANMGVET